MRLSLVVCTRNRAVQLERALQSFQRLRCDFAWELVIVDNGSGDETADIVAAYELRLPIRYVAEKRPGLGRARNKGWRAARGDIVAFTDDDCYPAEDFLTSIMRRFDESPTVGFVGGRVKLYDPRDLPVTIRDIAEPHLFAPGQFIRAGAIHGANFAFRRNVLEQVDGFDERFGAGTRFSCEDIDMMARVLAIGWYGAYDPRIVVAHHHGRRTLDDVKVLNREYDRGRGAYYVKCILNRRISYVSAKNWYWAMLTQSRAATFREVIAGAEFLVRNCGTAMRRLGRAPMRQVEASNRPVTVATMPNGSATNHS
jgi:glycosyltransferase involved in cell wall biosynthesis